MNINILNQSIIVRKLILSALVFFLLVSANVSAEVQVIEHGAKGIDPSNVPLNAVVPYYIVMIVNVTQTTTYRVGSVAYQAGRWCNELCYKPTPFTADGITFRIARSQCDNDLWGWIEPMENSATPVGEDGVPDHSRVIIYPPGGKINVTIPTEFADEVFTTGDAYIDVQLWRDACPFENPLTGDAYTYPPTIVARYYVTLSGSTSKQTDIPRRKLYVDTIVTPQLTAEQDSSLDIRIKVINLDRTTTLTYKFRLRGTVHWNTTTQSDKYPAKAYSTSTQSLTISPLSIQTITVTFPFYSTYFSAGDQVDFVVINADEDATDDPTNIKGTMGRDWVTVTAPAPCTRSSPDVYVSPSSYTVNTTPSSFSVQVSFTNRHSSACPTAYFNIFTTPTSPITVSPSSYTDIPVSSGGSVTRSFTVTVPSETSPGTYYVDFRVYDRDYPSYSTTKRLTITYSPAPVANFTVTKVIYQAPPYYVDETYKFIICAKNWGTTTRTVRIGLTVFANTRGLENKTYTAYPSYSWEKICNGAKRYGDICYVGAYTYDREYDKWPDIRTIKPGEEVCVDIDYKFTSESPANFAKGDKITLWADLWDDETMQFYSATAIVDVFTLEEIKFNITKIEYPQPPVYVDRTYLLKVCVKNLANIDKRVRIGLSALAGVKGITTGYYPDYPSYSWEKLCNGDKKYKDICYVGLYTKENENKWLDIATIRAGSEGCFDVSYKFTSESPANFDEDDKISLWADVWDDTTMKFYGGYMLVDAFTLEYEPLYACPIHLVASHKVAKLGEVVTYTAYIHNTKTTWNFTIYLGIGKWNATGPPINPDVKYTEPQLALMPPCNLECYKDTYGETFLSLVIPQDFTAPVTRKIKIAEYFPRGLPIDVAVGVYRTKVLEEKTKTFEGKKPVCFVYFKDITNISTEPSIVETLGESASRGIDSALEITSRVFGLKDTNITKNFIWGLISIIVAVGLGIVIRSPIVVGISLIVMLMAGTFIGWFPLWISIILIIIAGFIITRIIGKEVF
jgi:hypothetical protein